MIKTFNQLANIERLANYLDQLPANYPHFDMEDWFHPASGMQFSTEADEIQASAELRDPKIGSCGCALGHTIAAGINPCNTKSWVMMAQRVYGITGSEFVKVFAGDLAFVDNTPKGAARRLRALLPAYA